MIYCLSCPLVSKCFSLQAHNTNDILFNKDLKIHTILQTGSAFSGLIRVPFPREIASFLKTDQANSVDAMNYLNHKKNLLAFLF